MDGTTNIIELKGIGEKSATAFGRLGIRDVDSLITMYQSIILPMKIPKMSMRSRLAREYLFSFVSIRKFIFSMQEE